MSYPNPPPLSLPPPFVFPPPPSGGGGGRNSAFSPAVVAIIAVLGSAFLVVSYYRIFSKLCTRWQNRRDDLDMDGQVNGGDMDANAQYSTRGLDEALIKKISIFKYKTGDGFTVDTDCRVCLMEFTDEQELRLLPKCAHAFHVACIDTWLTTHSTCPLCRANIWPVEIMNQYPPAVTMFDGGAGGLSPGMDYGDGSRFNSGGGGHGRSPAPTLRGLLNYEDQQQQQHAIWIGSSDRIDPGDESIRLYDSRDHGGDSSDRQHSIRLSSASGIPPTPSICESPDRRSDAYLPTENGPQVRACASFKEPHTRSRDRDHRWRIPARRSSFRRKPFSSIVRSYSMGTSRRLVHALEFLDLEDARNSQSSSKGGDKLFGPDEYGIMDTPEFSNNLTISQTELQNLSSERQKSSSAVGSAGGEGAVRPPAGPSSNLPPDGLSDPELIGAALKSSGPGKGRSLSFRSPFSVKSLSGGRNMFSFRHSSRGRVVSTADSPILPVPRESMLQAPTTSCTNRF